MQNIKHSKLIFYTHEKLRQDKVQTTLILYKQTYSHINFCFYKTCYLISASISSKKSKIILVSITLQYTVNYNILNLN